MSGEESAEATRYWRRNLKLVGWLLAVWFLVSYGAGILLVEPLNTIHLGGFPLGFWFAQQGSIMVFIGLIAVYCVRMDRLDAAFREGGDEAAVAPDSPSRQKARTGRKAGRKPLPPKPASRRKATRTKSRR